MHPVCTLFGVLLVGTAMAADSFSPSWVKLVGGKTYDRAFSVATDADANCYVTGVIKSDEAVFGNNSRTNASGVGFFVAKYDRTGSNQWVWTTPGSGIVGRRVFVGQDGGVYVCANVTSYSLDRIPIGDTNVLSGWLIAKLNSAGALQWVRNGKSNSDGSSATPTGQNRVAVVFPPNGYLEIGGTIFTNGVLHAAYYDADGNLETVQALLGGAGTVRAVLQAASDSNGNILAAFDFSGTLDVAGTNITATSFNDGMIAQWSPAGTLKWCKHFKGSFFSHCYGVALATNDDALVAASISPLGLGSFEGTPLTGALLARIAPDGTTKWIRNFATNAEALGVIADAADNITVVGNLNSGNNVIGGNLLTNAQCVPFIARYNGNGDLRDFIEDRSDKQEPRYSVAFSAAVDPLGGTYVTGFGDGTMKIGDVVAENEFPSPIFLARIPPAAPKLDWTRGSAGVELRWPSSHYGFRIEQAAQPDGPWSPVTLTRTNSGTNVCTSIQPTNSAQFFRMREY